MPNERRERWGGLPQKVLGCWESKKISLGEGLSGSTLGPIGEKSAQLTRKREKDAGGPENNGATKVFKRGGMEQTDDHGAFPLKGRKSLIARFGYFAYRRGNSRGRRTFLSQKNQETLIEKTKERVQGKGKGNVPRVS